MSVEELKFYQETIAKDLDRTMKFWLDHSHDNEFGGFINCLGKDGKVFDTNKYVWLQGRQVRGR